MFVGYSIKEPLDILFRTDDARQPENLDRRIVRMHTHIHITLLAGRHNRLEEVFHIRTKLCLIDAFIQVQELAELLYRSLIVLTEVTTDKALRLDNNVFYQFMLFLWRHRLGEFIALGKNISPLAFWRGAGGEAPFLTGTLTFQDIDVEVCKLGIVEIEVRSTIGIMMQQVRSCPI